MKIIFLMLMFVSSFSYAGFDFGTWGTTCDDNGFIISLKEDSSPLVVSDNQIVISMHSKKITSKVIDVFFDNALDLGQGGMGFNWEEVDKAKKIAELTYSGNNKWLMKWFGFWDAKKQTSFWVKEPDFIQSHAKNDVIAMIKCEEQ
ncbi:hypothetical protein [Enterobacter roggenkampii]|uniref:hypothetical protein n=1 Tax=Enterobacter roggenkampii TaxID=1812935 RepID=UPI0005157A20|nr:hypothetical protein [Enterobacter roggenkampii]EKY3987729.1 hypothetical protein [Enterobacter roggenkampii]